jgi:hypothetical protein
MTAHSGAIRQLFANAPAAHGHGYSWPRVRAACHTLFLDASHRIAALSGLPQLSPDTIEWWSQLCTIPLPPCDLTALKARLYQFNVKRGLPSFQMMF